MCVARDAQLGRQRQRQHAQIADVTEAMRDIEAALHEAQKTQQIVIAGDMNVALEDRSSGAFSMGPQVMARGHDAHT